APFVRLLPANYADGVLKAIQEPELPNPRRISNVAMQGISGIPCDRNRTVLFVYFGFHVIDEILEVTGSGCPPEFLNIHIPSGDPVFDPNNTGNVQLPFQRSQWTTSSGQSPNNPRLQDIDDVILGMASQIAEREDNIVVSDLRDYVYGPMRDQFERIRDGDRFWFENTKNGLFTPSEIEDIWNTKYADVLLVTTNAEPQDIQRDVFYLKDGDPCVQPKQLNDTDLEPCVKVSTMHYFQGSGAGFGILIVALCCFPLAALLLAFYVAAVQKKENNKLRKKKVFVKSSTDLGNKIRVSEWQGPKEPLRPVSVIFDTEKCIKVMDSKRALIRNINLCNGGSTDIIQSTNNGEKALMLKVPKEYDLVLEIDGSNAGNLDSELSKKAKETLKCELTRAEFADALGLKEDSMFVEQMFSLADQDGNGYLSFREFLDIFVILMKGSPEAKSKLMFTMYDVDGNGSMSKDEFSQLLRYTK
ncbi:hypothetical protein scyTo_0011564, partial [Scyliorhinus torazame]|nr:hypothetical protein [Scyliorhinus torazame]